VNRVFLSICMVLALCLGISLVAPCAELTIRFGTPHALESAIGQGLLAVAQAFMETNPDINVEVESGWTLEKMSVATAGGVAPDLFHWWSGPDVPSQGLLRPLDDFIQRSGVKASDFPSAIWKAGSWNGKMYTLLHHMDAIGIMYYNKDKFAEAGLDEEKPPTTMTEFDQIFPRLTKTDADGKLVQIAMLPWATLYNPYNMIQLWSGSFGGNPWDFEKDEPVFTSNAVVEALTWAMDIKTRYQVPDSFVGGLWASSAERMLQGREVLAVDVVDFVDNIRKSHPDFRFGVTHTPFNPASTQAYPGWLGGWRAGISVLSPHPEEAWRFLHFLTSTSEGTATYFRASGAFPGYLRSPAFQEVARDPFKRPIVELANRATFGYALASSLYGPSAGDILGAAIIDIINTGVPIRSRLEQAQEQAMAVIREEKARFAASTNR
jgi:ABC-type glycerol-3-phosphate transport system substrate-binding protein